MKALFATLFAGLLLAGTASFAQEMHMGPKSRKKAYKAIKKAEHGNVHKTIKKAGKAVDKAEEGK